MSQHSDNGGTLDVVHASYARGPVRGGERQMLLLVEELARRGMSQAVMCRSGSALQACVEAIPGVRHVPVRHHLADGLWPIRAGLYHAHEARAAYWASIAALLTATPYVITRRVPNPISANRATRGVYARADAVVGISQAVCGTVTRDTGVQARLIYSAHRNLEADPQAVQRRRAEIGGGPVIGQVGALVDAHKGQSVSIGALARLRAAFPDAKLVLLGAGADEALLRRQADAGGGVVFAGHRDNVAEWIAACDLVVHPAYEEGLGSSLLDVMHLGVPLVASRVDGIPEIAQDGISALLVDAGDEAALADAAARVLDDKNLRDRLIAGGRAMADARSAAAMADSYLDIYRSAGI